MNRMRSKVKQRWFKLCFGILLLAMVGVNSLALSAEPFPGFLEAERNALQAQKAFQACIDFTRGWLAHRDPRSGLIPRNLTRDNFWNAQDAAADNYPFMVLSAALLDRELFQGTLLKMLDAEIRLTNRVDNLPDDYDFATQKFRLAEVDLPHLIFGGSEYVKDGLLPLTEWLGPSPWLGRMIGIQNSVWKHAPFETSYGRIPSNDFEINGEQLQVLCRLYWLTGDDRYRQWAFRLTDYYLLDHLPTDSQRLSLDDHGCEIISGLTDGYFLASFTDPERKEKYRLPIHRMLDRILEVAANEDGLFHMVINPQSGEISNKELTDNWGYDYNGVLNVAQLDRDTRYEDAVRHVLENIHKYLDYPWENGGADGYADSIEGAINLLNRIPVESGFQWVDASMQILLAKQRRDGIIEGWHGDGNFARTALMYALWKTQGVHAEPWRSDVAVGAVQCDQAFYLTVRSDWKWSGSVKFDIPRHRINFHLPSDYPRINQFPEWFTIDPEKTYAVSIDGMESQNQKGNELISGLVVNTLPNTPTHITVKLID